MSCTNPKRKFDGEVINQYGGYCVDCFTKGWPSYVCKDCLEKCHKNHKVINVGEHKFCCQCFCTQLCKFSPVDPKKAELIKYNSVTAVQNFVLNPAIMRKEPMVLVRTVVSVTNKLGFDCLDKVISPISLMMVLSLLKVGSSGITLGEFNKVIPFSDIQEIFTALDKSKECQIYNYIFTKIPLVESFKKSCVAQISDGIDIKELTRCLIY